MAISHENCSSESQDFCDQVLAACRIMYPSTYRKVTQHSCAFATEGANRFAYLYHKRSPLLLATIYMRGEDSDLIQPLSNGSTVQLRKEISGSWQKEFPAFIHLPFGSSANDAAELLMTYSMPLSISKRKIKKIQVNHKSTKFFDGKIQLVLATTYERNPKSRKACLEYHGFRCAGCDQMLSEKYGEIAKTLVHVHHLERLADSGKTVIDPINDLVPLCPNCHSVVHLRVPPISIRDLRKLIFHRITPISSSSINP